MLLGVFRVLAGWRRCTAVLLLTWAGVILPTPRYAEAAPLCHPQCGAGSEPAVDITGDYSGTYHSDQGGNGGISVTFNQAAAAVTGILMVTGSSCFSSLSFAGTVAGNSLCGSFTDDSTCLNIQGTVDGTEINGTYGIEVGIASCIHDTGVFALATAAAGKLLTNGDFSSDLQGWTEGVVAAHGDFPHFNVSSSHECLPSQAGNKFFGLDVPFGANGYIEQSVLLPGDAELSLRTWGSLQTVTATVSVIDQGGVEHVLEQFTPPPLDLSYTFPGPVFTCTDNQPLVKVYAVVGFAGQHVKIRLRATSNGYDGTFANFDDVTLTSAGPPPPACIGDCNGKGQVTVDELLTLVNIALGNADVSTCFPGDANHDQQITIDEILTAVNNALNGCSGG